MDNSDFWDSLIASAYTPDEVRDSLSLHLASDEDTEIPASLKQGRGIGGGQFKSVRALTDKGRAESALVLPVDAGTKVAFETNIGSLMSYENPPEQGSVGTVTTVRSASGDVTSHDGMVFVRWDNGTIQGIHAAHLRLASGSKRTAAAAKSRIRVASLGDLTDFLRIGSDTLVHKATQDLWKLTKDPQGFVIERLFDDNGGPLKV